MSDDKNLDFGEIEFSAVIAAALAEAIKASGKHVGVHADVPSGYNVKLISHIDRDIPYEQLDVSASPIIAPALQSIFKEYLWSSCSDTLDIIFPEIGMISGESTLRVQAKFVLLKRETGEEQDKNNQERKD